MDPDEQPIELDLSTGKGGVPIVHDVTLTVCECTGQKHVTLTAGPMEPGDFIDALRMMASEKFREAMLDHLARMMTEMADGL